MDTLDALYSSYSTQATLAAAQALKSDKTTAAQASATSLSFQDLLASFSGTSGQDSSAQMKNYLLSGLADGSIPVTDSNKLVSALLGTLNTGATGLGTSGDLLDMIDTSMLSQDMTTALLGLQQNAENDWVQQFLDALSSPEGKQDDNLQAYYQAMAALTEAQKNTLLG